MQAGADFYDQAHTAFLRGTTPEKTPSNGDHIIGAVESMIVAEHLRNVFANGDEALFDIAL